MGFDVPIQTRIAELFDELPGSQQKVADFVISDTSNVAFMTLQELAEASGSSRSAVERFVRSLGFAGYPEFRAASREGIALIQLPLTAIKASLSTELPLGESYAGAIAEAAAFVGEAANANQHETIESVLKELTAARRVMILGLGFSTALAQIADFHFSMALANTVALTLGDSSSLLRKLVHLEPGDVMLAITYPPYAAQTVSLAAYAKSRGATVIALTDSPSSPLTSVGAYSLFAKSVRSSGLNSLTGPVALIEALAFLLIKESPNSLEAFEVLARELGPQ